MKFSSPGQTEKYRIEICCINVIILFYLFRTAIPVFKFPFIILYFCFIGYFLIYYKKKVISALKDSIYNYYLLLILSLIIIVAFLFSNKLYLTIFKDVINMIILLSILLMSDIVVPGKKEFDFYVSNLVNLIVFFAFIISGVGLLFLFDILTYKDFLFNNSLTEISVNESLTDYNFALLPVLFGFIGILILMAKTKNRLQKVLYSVSLILFSLQIFFSGSRRGLIIFILGLLFLTVTLIFTNKESYMKLVAKESVLFIILLLLLACLTYIFITKTPYYYKNRFLELIGSKNILITKDKITKQVLRYFSPTDQSSNYLKLYNILWTPSFNPDDPDSSWGNRIHKTIFPLTGENVEIVPVTAKGYLMDSTCNASYYSGIDLSESYSLLANLKVYKGDRYRASVFCLVSDNFDGNAVLIGVGSASINSNIVSGKVTTNYNLENKGVWQKLEIEFDCINGEISILIDFWKNGVKSFAKLKGYVIFAYPQYEKINDNKNCLSLISTKIKKDITETRKIDFAGNLKDQVISKTSYQIDEICNENDSYPKAINQIIRYNNVPLNNYISEHKKYSSTEISGISLLTFFASVSILNDRDPVRIWASRFISEDTIYYGYKNELLVDPKWNKFNDNRIVRWIFATQIFSKEFTWKQKIFGGGFNFLNWYGYYFLKDKIKSDWPHNPFLSILLYSGIIGLSIYLFFLYKVFYYYLKYVKGYPILFIFFLITFFFSFFSGGSPFDPPIMGFFVILPFFMHSVHKKTEK
jgi:hypothetical protein